MTIAVVGSGGKTTLIKKLASQYRSEGKTVLVTTTTHMFIEGDTLLTDDAERILQVLKKNGYVAEYEVIEGKPRGVLKVTIFEPGTVAKINEISKVSKPGRRVYSAAEDLPVIKSGRGMIIVSTSKGLMTGREAKKNRLGGEILVKVW